MSPAPMATREERDPRPAQSAWYPPPELLQGPAKEMVVDWQLPSESDRKS